MIKRKFYFLITFWYLVLFFAPLASAKNFGKLNSEELMKMLEKKVFLIDIRREEEWKQTGVIEGSKLLTAFEQGGKLNPEFSSRFISMVEIGDEVILICRTGTRTSILAQKLIEQMGYQQVYHVQHGITQWIREGHPVKPAE